MASSSSSSAAHPPPSPPFSNLAAKRSAAPILPSPTKRPKRSSSPPPETTSSSASSDTVSGGGTPPQRRTSLHSAPSSGIVRSTSHIKKKARPKIAAGSHASDQIDPSPETTTSTANATPEIVPVTCFGIHGDYNPRTHEVRCLCDACNGTQPSLGITRWEAHTGCRHKKWKLSVKLRHDSSRTLLSFLQSMVDAGAKDLAFLQVISQKSPKSQHKKSARPSPTVVVNAAAAAMAAAGSRISAAKIAADQTFSTPEFVPVTCVGVHGAYYPRKHEVRCFCDTCKGKKPLLGITRWEAHTGCRHKKWKLSVVLQQDSGRTLLSWLQSMADAGATDLAFPVYTPEESVKSLLRQPYEAVVMKWTAERCAVCRWAEDYDDNQMLVCNRCQMAVHEECYGVRAAEAGGAAFVCRACGDGGRASDRQCCLCPVRGGALKPCVDVPGLWVHIFCAWFVPGMSFEDVSRMEPALLGVAAGAAASLRRFSQRCTVCGQIHGACIQCEDCEAMYHATCAIRAGYRMEIGGGRGGRGFKNLSYCAKHREPAAGEEGKLVIAAAEAAQAAAERESLPEASGSEASGVAYEEGEDMPVEAGEGEQITSRCVPYEWAARKAKRQGGAGGSAAATTTTAGAVLHIPGGYSRHTYEEIEAIRRKSEAAPPVEAAAATLEERLARLGETEGKRICYGRSAIHRWGVFARREIGEGEMVVEYKGEVVRRAVADARERRYRAEGAADCYLFAAGGEEVVDATRKGNLARLINHSCSPNCYARLIPSAAGGSADSAAPRIVLIAKRPISLHEEITYDYLFLPENRLLPCLCAAPNCRKFIC